METIQLITTMLQGNPYFAIATAVVTLASTISAVTPKPKSGGFWSKVSSVISVLALNVGGAKKK